MGVFFRSQPLSGCIRERRLIMAVWTQRYGNQLRKSLRMRRGVLTVFVCVFLFHEVFYIIAGFIADYAGIADSWGRLHSFWRCVKVRAKYDWVTSLLTSKKRTIGTSLKEWTWVGFTGRWLHFLMSACETSLRAEWIWLNMFASSLGPQATRFWWQLATAWVHICTVCLLCQLCVLCREMMSAGLENPMRYDQTCWTRLNCSIVSLEFTLIANVLFRAFPAKVLKQAGKSSGNLGQAAKGKGCFGCKDFQLISRPFS